MANVILTFKIMPVSPEVNMEELTEKINAKVIKFSGGETKTELEPIAFGLKAIKIIFVIEESRGSADELEDDIRAMEEVNSIDVVDVRRALG